VAVVEYVEALVGPVIVIDGGVVSLPSGVVTVHVNDWGAEDETPSDARAVTA